MPVVVRPRRKTESGKKYKVVDLETGKVVAESDRYRNALLHAKIRNLHFLRKRITWYKGEPGVWVTTRTGKRVFIPLDKYLKKFGIPRKWVQGMKIRSKGRGRGLGKGRGRGPIGIPKGELGRGVNLTKPLQAFRTEWLFDGEWVPSVLITLKGRGCQHNKCVFCYYSKYRYPEVTDDQILRQIETALKENKGVEGVVLYTNGSFTDDVEIPPELRERIFDLLESYNIKRLLVESRADKPLSHTLELARKHNIELQVALGVEVASSLIRNRILRKNLTNQQIERAIHEIRRAKFEPRVYLLLKPPYVKEREAVNQLVEAVDWLSSLGVRTFDINVARPHPKAKLFWAMYQAGKWKLPQPRDLAKVVAHVLNKGLYVDVYTFREFGAQDEDTMKLIRRAVNTQSVEPLQQFLTSQKKEV